MLISEFKFHSEERHYSAILLEIKKFWTYSSLSEYLEATFKIRLVAFYEFSSYSLRVQNESVFTKLITQYLIRNFEHLFKNLKKALNKSRLFNLFLRFKFLIMKAFLRVN